MELTSNHNNHGFRILLEDGRTISVQFGPGTYSSLRSKDMKFLTGYDSTEPRTVDRVEVAIVEPNGTINNPVGYMSVDELFAHIYRGNFESLIESH